MVLNKILLMRILLVKVVVMAIQGKELEKEKLILKGVNKNIANKLKESGLKLSEEEEKRKDFLNYAWEHRNSMDENEAIALRVQGMLEDNRVLSEEKYFKKLFRVQNNPYFASILFKEDNGKKHVIYIGLTYLKDKKLNNIIYDWRSPICSMYYDYEVGKASYVAPERIISGDLTRKRQYKIVNKELIRLFDNSINIDDDLLQEVLANESNEKMKNIVNTIQQEQNSVIRNVKDKNLIVEGIAGSGKTSVALHRIAFLLYKIPNLKSSNVLIFSPNNIFTEYISNVLPELGEDNTLQTTFQDYLINSIDGYKNVESFLSFISRYYQKKNSNEDLIFYKQSDEIIEDINQFVKWFVDHIKFKSGFIENEIYSYTKEDLNELFHTKYRKLVFFDRLEEMAIRLCESNYKGKRTKLKTYRKLINEALGINCDIKNIFCLFFKSSFAKIKMNDNEIKSFLNSDEIKYEDALIYVYIKGLLRGFNYEKYIEQVVIDEAQDYSKLQFIIISKIFKRSSFTILGDVNQTINPYYKYSSLAELKNIFESSIYLQLLKTYRSSEEIINYTNKILGLKHVSAIRKSNNIPVTFCDNYSDFISEVNVLLSKYKSLAIITKDDESAKRVYELLDDACFELVLQNTVVFKKDKIVIPAYVAKGLEFDAVMVYSDKDSRYMTNEKNLLYVACTRAQHQLVICNIKK